MALKNQVSNVYSAGLHNAGSYQVSGQPFVARRAVGKDKEVKISFPSVTKNVTVRIPTPPNAATEIICVDAASDATFLCTQNGPTTGVGSLAGQLPRFGSSSVGDLDKEWTLSLWISSSMTAKNEVIARIADDAVWRGSLKLPGSGENGFNGLAFNMPNSRNADRSGFSPESIWCNLADNAVTCINDGEYHHVVVTYKTGSTYLYLDGGQRTTNAVSYPTNAIGSVSGSNDTRIMGANTSATIQQRKVDEVTFWTTGFSNDEVVELMNSGEYFDPTSHSLSANLQDWWTMGDAFGDNWNAVQNNSLTQRMVFSKIDDRTSLQLMFYNSVETYRYATGPFDTQTAGKIRVSPVQNLIGGMNFPDEDSSGAIDNQLNIPNSYDVENAPMTLAFWFKPQAGIPSSLSRFVGWSAGGMPVRYKPNGGGDVQFKVAMFGASINVTVSGVTDDVWHNFCLVFDSDDDLLSLYINGALAGSATMTAYLAITDWAIPLRGTGRVENFAEYTFFDGARSAIEINELYNGGYPKDPRTLSFGDKLSHWYRFNEDLAPADTTTTIYDRIGSNDATIGIGSEPRNANFIAGPISSVEHNKNYYEFQGYGSSIQLPMKTKELYLRGVGAQVTFEVIAELTNIPQQRMYTLSGSGINE